MKQFIAVLIDELGGIELENIRLIPAENKKEAIELYSKISKFTGCIEMKFPEVIGYMEFEDGYQCPVFTHDFIMTTRKEFQVRPSSVPVIKKPTITDEEPELKRPSELYEEALQKRKDAIIKAYEDMKCNTKKTFLVGIPIEDYPDRLLFKFGTVMAISANNSSEACDIYRTETANYIESSALISIEVISEYEEIIALNGIVKNNPFIEMITISNEKTGYLSHKIIVLPNETQLFPNRLCSSLIDKLSTSTINVFLQKSGLVNDDVTLSDYRIDCLLFPNSSKIWFKRETNENDCYEKELSKLWIPGVGFIQLTD